MPDPSEVHVNSRNCPMGGAGNGIRESSLLNMMNLPPEVALIAVAHASPVAGEAHTSRRVGVGGGGGVQAWLQYMLSLHSVV